MPQTVLNCTKNVTISSKYTTQSYRNGYLGFGRGSGNDEYRLLLDFSAATGVIPAGVTVESAVLTVPKVTGTIGSNAGFTATANRITSAWSESSTWESGNPSYTDAGVTTAATGTGHSGNISFDVTSMVQAWVNGTTQYGILLRKATSGGTYIKVAQERGAYITVTYGYRASTFSTDGNAVAGTAETISVSAQSSALTHDLVLSFGSKTWTLHSKKAASAITTWTPPMEVLNQIPNATSGNGTLTLTTYNGSTPVGSGQISVTISAPASVVPSVTGLAAAISGNAVAAGWGVYVKNHSKVKLTASGAAGAYGSGIKSYNFSGNGWSTSVGANTVESATLVSSGNLTFSVTVTDTRGRVSAAKTVTISVANYAEPSFSSLSVVRADASGNPAADGTYILVTASASYSAVGQNSVAIKASVSPGGWSGTLSGGRLLLGGGGVDITQVYTVTTTATDSLGGQDQRNTTVYTANRIINVTTDGSGVAVGGFATTKKFTSYLPVVLSGGIDPEAITFEQLDTAVKTGFYQVTAKWQALNNISFNYAVMQVIDHSDYNFQQILYPIQTNARLVRYGNISGSSVVWGAWECDNPPMYLGVEYRTTERHNGKPVYVKAVDLGALPNNAIKGVSYTTVKKQTLRCTAACSNGDCLPMNYPTDNKKVTVYASGNNVQIWTNYNLSDCTGIATVWYTDL